MTDEIVSNNGRETDEIADRSNEDVSPRFVTFTALENRVLNRSRLGKKCNTNRLRLFHPASSSPKYIKRRRSSFSRSRGYQGVSTRLFARLKTRINEEEEKSCSRTISFREIVFKRRLVSPVGSDKN